MDQPIMPPIPDEQGNNNDVTFNVMPQGGKSFAPPNVPTPQTPSPGSSMTIGVHSSKNKWIYIILGIIVVLALGAGAYYLLGKKSTAPVVDTTDKLSKVWLTQYFNVDTCADESTCGLHVDPDTDGLDNFAEFKVKTNPLNPDSDMDGLADGDEINVYKTDPTLKYTDQRSIVVKNDWSDGFQIKGGYDPLTPGVLFTESRKQQIEDDKAKFNLHEPSITTTTAAPADPTADWKTYADTKYGFEFRYPNSINDAPVLVKSPLNGYKFADEPAGVTYTFDANKNTWSKGGNPPVAKTTNDVKWFYTSIVDIGQGHFALVPYPTKKIMIEIHTASEEVLNQILSTFKFTDSVSTANWKTYADTKYGYSFKYPLTFPDPTTANSKFSVTYSVTESGTVANNRFTGLDKAKIYKTLEIGGLKANEFYMTECQGCSDVTASQPLIQYVLLWQGHPLTIQFFGNIATQAQIDQILSTFKFTK